MQHKVLLQPDYLKVTDKVALISPSYFSSEKDVTKAAETICSWGMVPVIGPNVGKKYAGQYAGTVDERISDLQWALFDPDIKAIICNRGGYGTIQLISQLNFCIRNIRPKWLIGFSDISILHGLLNRNGIMSIHGTMGFGLAKDSTGISSTLLRNLLMGSVPRYELPTHPQNIEGKATGILVGGNLCSFASILRTMADATHRDDLILFIEEVGESMRNIDRQFQILTLNGVLNRCKGIILGEFTECGDDLSYKSIEQMLCSYLKKYKIPVLCSFPAGHDVVNVPLLMGSSVTIDIRSDGATLQFNVEGHSYTVKTQDI